MRAISLFSGAGGFELGFGRAGIETVLQVESDPWCLGVLRYRFKDVPKVHDVRSVGSSDYAAAGAVGLVYGGFPCQDASIAGDRRGFDGDRTSLWWEFARIVTATRPAWVIAENVPGLLTVNRGADFAAILDSLDECGYGLAWRVLNARSFGVAQDRRRLFLVGRLGARGAEAVLDDGDTSAVDLAPHRGAGTGATTGLDGRPEDSGRALSFIERTRPSGRRLEWREEVACALTTNNGGGRSDIGNVCFNGYVRQLLPVERERLAGWPDDWTRYARTADGAVLEVSKTQRMSMTGNGVAAPVAHWLGLRLLAANAA